MQFKMPTFLPLTITFDSSKCPYALYNFLYVFLFFHNLKQDLSNLGSALHLTLF